MASLMQIHDEIRSGMHQGPTDEEMHVGDLVGGQDLVRGYNSDREQSGTRQCLKRF